MELVGIEGDVVVLGKVTGQQADEVDEDFLHTLGRLAVYDQGEKAYKTAKYLHARVVSDNFCIVSDLDLWEKQCTFAA